MAEVLQPAGRLPWSGDEGERRLFRRILVALLLVALAPAVWIPWIELPQRDRAEAEAIPPQLARLVERKAVPPAEAVSPPPPAPEPVPEVSPQPESVPEVAMPRPEPAPAKPAPEPVAPSQTVEQARAVASRSGLLGLRSELAKIRDAVPAVESARLAANVTTAAVESQAGTNPVEVLAGSGGITETSGPVHEVAVAGHTVREVASAPTAQTAAVARAKPSPAARKGPAERGMTNIRKVFDAQKTALYTIYRRELRQDPGLEGKVLLELVIEPDGSVSHCEVVSSELDNPALESRLASRVRLFNFGADNVESRRVRFPIDFLPG